MQAHSRVVRWVVNNATADAEFSNLFFSLFSYFFPENYEAASKTYCRKCELHLGLSFFFFFCNSCKHNTHISDKYSPNSNHNPLSPRWLTNTLVLFPVMSREFFKEGFFLYNVPFFFCNPFDSLMRDMKFSETKPFSSVQLRKN